MAWNLINLLLSLLWFSAGILKIAGIGTPSDIPFGGVFLVIGAVFLWGVFEDLVDRPRRLSHTYVGGMLAFWLGIYSAVNLIFYQQTLQFDSGAVILSFMSFLLGIKAKKKIEAMR